MNRVTILGSGFAVASSTQDNTHLLIQSAECFVLVDCGNNPVGKLEHAGVQLNQVTDLVLTHAHADHMGALPLLVMDMWLCKRQTPLRIFGLPYTLERAKLLLDLFDWQKWQGMFPVEFINVDEKSQSDLIKENDFTLSALPVQHTIPNIGIRANFGSKGKTIVYSSDTEPCENLDRLASGADVLIQEAAGPGKGHTSPEQAGKTAQTIGVKKLILIHYNHARKEQELLGEAKINFSGEVILAKDMMVVE